MPSLTSLSLNLKLGDLVPLNSIFGVSADTLIRYARDVQNSGSDLVTEQDLHKLFGRSLVDGTLALAFRKHIRQATKSHQLLELISLELGAGPTVRSAIASNENAGAFATVVQLSFLSSMHKLDALAEAISAHFQNLALEVNSTTNLDEISIPDEERISGVITTCQEQTQAWDWNQYLYTVADRLRPLRRSQESVSQELTDWRFATEPIADTVLSGLIQCLPLVQRFPLQYRLQVHSDIRGVCTIVVWAHYILGITVEFRCKGTVIRFPASSTSGSASMIFVADPSHPSIMLFEAAGQTENIFTLSSVSIDQDIDSITTTRARGRGIRWIRDELGQTSSGDPVTVELALMACGFALLLLDHLVYTRSEVQAEVEMFGRPCVQPKTFDAAARFLFDLEPMQTPKHFTYKSMCERKSPIPPLESTPKIVQAHFLANEYKDWSSTSGRIKALALILLALCHVKNLEECNELRFIDNEGYRDCQVPLRTRLLEWDGMSEIHTDTNVWFLILQERIDEKFNELHDTTVALVCRRGWSIFVNTIGLPDPALDDAGIVVVREGVPSRRGIRKHYIRFGMVGAEPAYEPGHMRTVEKTTTSTYVLPKVPPFSISALPTLVSQPQDSFIVRLRIRYEIEGTHLGGVLETSYRHLWDSLRCVQKTKRCHHDPFQQVSTRLDKDEIIVQDYGGIAHDIPSLDETRIFIFPTVGHVLSRYFALAWLHNNATNIPAAVLLRTRDCCFPCAMGQASGQAKIWCIIT